MTLSIHKSLASFPQTLLHNLVAHPTFKMGEQECVPPSKGKYLSTLHARVGRSWDQAEGLKP